MVSDAGASLIEMLVALAILAMLAGVLSGGALSAVRRMNEHAEVEKIVTRVERARIEAMLEGRTRVLGTGALSNPPWIEAPEGWSVSATPAITFTPLGECSGGRIRIATNKSHVFQFDAEPFSCGIRKANNTEI